MRNPDRIRNIIRALEALWLTQPDTRLGQLIDNLQAKIRNTKGEAVDPFFVEDDVMLTTILQELDRS